MKDVHITAQRLKKELIWFGICFLIAEGLNIYAIKSYATEWKELYTQFFVVLVLSIVIYIIVGSIRFLIRLIRKREVHC